MSTTHIVCACMCAAMATLTLMMPVVGMQVAMKLLPSCVCLAPVGWCRENLSQLMKD